MDIRVYIRSIFLLSVAFAGSATAQSRTPLPPEFAGWLPVTDAERAQKAPVVEKDAGAEILQWRVRVADELQGGTDLQRIVYNYVRVKVFDQKGQEQVTAIDLPYREPGTIESVSGRTIKPDGTILELDSKTVLRRVVAKVGRLSEKAVSFSMPGVEPGTIVDYRWKQIEDDNRFRYFRLHFQRDLPIQHVTYYMKPLSNIFISEQMFLQAFHCQPTKPEPGRDGWLETSLHNLPAFHHEPYAPSDPNLEQWALLYYRKLDAKAAPDKFWSDEGKQLFKQLKESLKVSDEMKSAVSQATGSAKTDDEKLAALAAYLRKNVRSIFDSSVTSAERAQYFQSLPKGRERNAAEVFKIGLASSDEMNRAFAALAIEAGLDARLALLASHNEIEFQPKTMADSYFLDRHAVAVKQGEGWNMMDLSRKHLPAGMLPWDEEGVFALISDPKEPRFVKTNNSPPEASIDEHLGHFKLSPEGTLSGDASERYTGHRAAEYRGELAERSPAQQEEFFRDRLAHVFPRGDFTDLKIENANDAEKPLRITYHLNAPGFAQVTGKRTLFQPNAYRRAQNTPFTASERKSIVQFPYAWKEVDRIRIDFPDGYDLENADNPGSLKLGNLGAYNLDMVLTKTGPARSLNTIREFTFGGSGNLYFDVGNYPALKKVFDEIRVRDTHSISIKAN
jgi:hypothetical protein